MATSKIKGGIEKFTLTNPTGFSTFEGKGIYDHHTGMVRLYISAYNATSKESNVIANVPAQYRPSESLLIPGVVGIDGGGVYCYPASVIASNGNVTHAVSASTRMASVVGEYKL